MYSSQTSHLRQTSPGQTAVHGPVVLQSIDYPEPLLLFQPLKHHKNIYVKLSQPLIMDKKANEFHSLYHYDVPEINEVFLHTKTAINA